MPFVTLQRYLREPVNSLSHFVGIVLSLVGLGVLIVSSAGEPWRLTSFRGFWHNARNSTFQISVWLMLCDGEGKNPIRQF
jgi:predicted membrane channel-forming protein YqfA (hemolysin III family)